MAGLAWTLFEVLVTAGAFLAAVWLRERLHLGFLKVDFAKGPVLALLPIACILWAPLLWRFGLHRAARTDGAIREIGRVMGVVALGTLLLVVATFVLRAYAVSRAFIGLFAAVDFAALLFFRVFAIALRQHAHKRGYDRSFVLIVGTGRRARNHAQSLLERGEWGLAPIGFISETPGLKIDQVAGLPLWGSIADIASILRKQVIDEVHFAVSRRTLERLDEALTVCDEIGVRARILLNVFGGLRSHVTLEPFEGIPLLTLSTPPHDGVGLLLKRMFDMIVSLMALMAALPVLLIAGLLVKVTSKGPVFFRQKRVGMNGRPFTLYKFRTMVADAEAQRAALESKNEMDGPVFKIKNDPRVTGVGRVLRKLSIDELPQLYNVLRGDMSIVGPRPPIATEVEKYERWQRRRLSMRPGITCIWQVSGRNNVDFRRWMEMDLEYIDNWSLGLDFKIILKTIPAVLFSRGAS